MIDLHSHLLPKLDDGPADVSGSLAMARAAVADGINTAVATPHIDHMHSVRPRGILEAAAKLRAALLEERVPLEILLGGEIAVTRVRELEDPELRDLALGHSSWVLLECPLRPAGQALAQTQFDLSVRGFSSVLAHPERSPDLIGRVDRVEELVGRGALCSVSAGALTGQFGTRVKRFALDLLDAGLVHNVASDGHDHRRRPLALAAALRVATDRVGAGFADWACELVPTAILGDRSIPAPPPRAGGRLRRHWRTRFSVGAQDAPDR